MQNFFQNDFSLKNLKDLNIEDLDFLAKEIREKIISVLSKNGGHLSSNLGIVELTIALHYVFNSPEDKFIFDTSHQVYTHKILTGRFKEFDTLRQYGGISGFSNPEESNHDHVYSGHAGTAISTALGIAQKRDFFNKNYKILPIIGDATLTCGLALEALNNIPKNLKNFILVLNDNEMAISKNVGNIKNILSRLLNNPVSNKIYLDILNFLGKVPNYGEKLKAQGKKITESIKNLVSSAAFFEEFGLSYVGPIDGHDTKKLIETFRAIKDTQVPTIVHTITVKGKGMQIAIQNPTSYHGAKPFDIDSGQFISKIFSKPKFPQIFGNYLVKLTEENKNIFCISPATESGSNLTKFSKLFENNFFDVGIAEGHAVTFSGGLCHKKRLKPFVCIYSSFVLRALDNIFHDVCLQNLPVTFALDRSFISGPDGSSHHGIYDISFLSSMPNILITAPRDGDLLKDLMFSSLSWNHPSVIRYPNLETLQTNRDPIFRKIAKCEILEEGKNVLIVAMGHMIDTAKDVRNILLDKNITTTIIDPIFIKPLDEKTLLEEIFKHDLIITLEEHMLLGGFATIFNNFIVKNSIYKKVINFGIDNLQKLSKKYSVDKYFVGHGKNEKLLKDLKLDSNSIASKILNHFNKVTELLGEKHDYSPLSQ